MATSSVQMGALVHYFSLIRGCHVSEASKKVSFKTGVECSLSRNNTDDKQK
jgi:hypothetical protein